jgi:hypothetical protein
MTDHLTLMLPIIWAITSTLIGMLLYRSSNALFEQESVDKQRTRRIRLAGSVVIAVVAFIGMQRATPKERLGGIHADSVCIPDTRMLELERIIRDIDRLKLEIDGCFASEDYALCTTRLQTMHTAITDLRQFLISTKPPTEN